MQFADDIDDLHFAIGKRAADSARTPVAVVRRSLMDEWLTTLRSSGLEPDSMYADSALLPENPGQAVALMEVAKLVNELRNAVVLVGLVMGKELHYDAAVNAAR